MEGIGIFSPTDIEQIHREGLTTTQVADQLRILREGVPYVELDRPCRVGDGIATVPADEHAALVRLYEEAAAMGRSMKFVPASGAASRMFRRWFRHLEALEAGGEVNGAALAAELKQYAFYGDLEQSVGRDGGNLAALLEGRKYAEVLSYILKERGLNYGGLPKALLKFHTYADGTRTALEEHLVEAALYVRDREGVCRVHFTVSPEHAEAVRTFIATVKAPYEGKYGVHFDIGLSVQETATNTIAVGLDDYPFRSADGRLSFHPGGHGTLLYNLNRLRGDVVFIKNIDNVVPDRLKGPTVHYKKVLGGYLLALQERVFSFLRTLEKGKVSPTEIDTVEFFCRERLFMTVPDHGRTSDERAAALFALLNRPLRVCGVVKNEGEPGGGPFWVRGEDGLLSLQIVEESQIDRAAPDQRAVWEAATHFNPVDLVCGIRDYRGRPFDLARFVNPSMAIVTVKSERGWDIKVLEHPGLWNGAMAYWITLFVEVPIVTFNPVKTVEDLLRPQHLP